MNTTITASAFLVTMIVSYLIPLATALITKLSASALVKQLVTAFLSAVTGFLTVSAGANGTAVFSAQSVLFAALSFAIANISYLSIFKPHDADAKILPTAGIG